MDKKQEDRRYDGMKLTDSQLDVVVGGLNMPPKQAVAQAMAVKAVAKPIFRK